MILLALTILAHLYSMMLRRSGVAATRAGASPHSYYQLIPFAHAADSCVKP